MHMGVKNEIYEQSSEEIEWPKCLESSFYPWVSYCYEKRWNCQYKLTLHNLQLHMIKWFSSKMKNSRDKNFILKCTHFYFKVFFYNCLHMLYWKYPRKQNCWKLKNTEICSLPWLYMQCHESNIYLAPCNPLFF